LTVGFRELEPAHVRRWCAPIGEKMFLVVPTKIVIFATWLHSTLQRQVHCGSTPKNILFSNRRASTSYVCGFELPDTPGLLYPRVSIRYNKSHFAAATRHTQELIRRTWATLACQQRNASASPDARECTSVLKAPC